MTELIWEGKYDKDGKKVAPIRIALPFQNIETVNESTEDRKKTLDMFASGKPTEWRNRLIWGDKKYVLPSLLTEFAGKVNLIYIDPPLDTGADFSFTAQIPDNPDTKEDEAISFTKQPSLIEQKAYRDTWGRGLDSYLQWFYETCLLLRDLLAEDGSIYVHLDWHLLHYAKAVLDEIFGYENFQREIIWSIETASGYKSQANNWIRSHDTILFYSKSKNFNFNKQFIELDERTIKRYDKVDKDGKRYKVYYNVDRSERRVYLDTSKGRPVTSVWSDVIGFQTINNTGEYVNYPTQKPEALLERIIKASSKPGDLIVDCFCGSGTTAVVADKLSRRWVTCDLGRFSIHTARKRLLGIEEIKPFNVQNLGKYERQQWAQAEFPTDPEERAEAEKTYRNFIIELYQGQPITGYTWLHGTKAGRMIHVGAVDSPVAIGDIKQIVQEFWKVAGKSKDAKVNGVDVLGWDFAFDINETAKQIAAEHNIDLKTKKIPREVLEKKAVEQGDIKFYELAFLNVKHKVAKKKLSLELKDFIVPPDDIPEEVVGHITHWSQWIDYWAVDWDYKDDTFHNQWQSYRTKKSPDIDLKVEHEYEAHGNYQVVVKVIDILGNDTTKQIVVEV